MTTQNSSLNTTTTTPARGYMPSAKTVDWSTPQKLFDELHREFRFNLDPASSAENHKCPRFFTEADNGLAQNWGKSRVYCNPPYGRVIKHWMKKAADASELGATVVMLVPARTDTGWFHDIAMKQELRFLRGRLKFGTSKNAAPFGCVLVVFRPRLAAVGRTKART